VTAAAAERWYFAEGVPKALDAGTHRIMPPEDTLERVRWLLPMMGITRIANVTGLDRIGIPVVVVCRPNSRSLAVSQGKGTTLAAARASGVMESIEAYHAERITLPLKLASLEELRYTHRVVDVEALPRSSHSQFHPYLPLVWIEGFDLLGRESMWVPFEMVHTNYTIAARVGAGAFQATSNGLASGNDFDEAVSHALCEDVERDATTLWHLTDREAQAEHRVDLETVDDPECRRLLDLYEEAKIDVGVWETTSDVGVACFLCMIADERDTAFHRLYPTAGMGCHPSRSVALSRALTEAAQSRLTAIAGSRDDVTRTEYERFRHPDKLRRFREQLDADQGAGKRAFHAAPSKTHATVREDVLYLLARLEAVGIKHVVVFDLSRPEFPIAVVRAVIPGLEGVNLLPDYLPGRRARAAAAAAS
jgi:YcaO-like protein with predicted kinase domain